MKRLILFLFLSTALWATTPVTGNIKNLGTGNVGGGFVRFWLRGCAGNQPRITGSGIVAPSLGGVYYFDFAANGFGAISGTLYSNRDASGTGPGEIECGGSFTSTWYGMQAYQGGKGGPEVPVLAVNGLTLDISTVTPIATNPVGQSPTPGGPLLGNPQLFPGAAIFPTYTLTGTMGQSGQQSIYMIPNIDGVPAYHGGSTNTVDELTDVFGKVMWLPFGSGFPPQQLLGVTPLPTGIDPFPGSVPAFVPGVGYVQGGPINVAALGQDVRITGAALNGNGQTAIGTDDSAAIVQCMKLYGNCVIPSIFPGGTTYVRWATPQTVVGSGFRKLSCAGSNNNGLTQGTGSVEIDVDMGAQTGGPALMIGSPTTAPFNGITIDGSCHFRDISTNLNSPGAVGLINVSNVRLDAGATNFTRTPMATATVAPANVASCTTSGGSISNTATIFAKYEALGPGYGTALPSSEVSKAVNTIGCTSGSACSCTPLAPTTIDSTSPAVIVMWGTSSNAEFQVGLPYACSGGTCAMTQNFTYGQALTTATPVTSIPTTGNAIDNLDHSGGYAYYLQGTKNMNCGLHGDTCNNLGFSNQPSFNRNDFRNNYVSLNFDNSIAEANVSNLHVDLCNGGKYGIQSESAFNLNGGHFEINCGGGTNQVHIQVASPTPVKVSNIHYEGGSATTPTAISIVGSTGNSFTNELCDNGIITCYTEDSSSAKNVFTGSAVAGTVTCRQGSICWDTQGKASTVSRLMYSTASSTVNNSIGSTQMVANAPNATVNWTISFYAFQVGLGSGGSCNTNTEIVGNVIFQDPAASGGNTIPVAAFVIPTAGTANTPISPASSGAAPATIISSTGGYAFQTKANTAINYSTTVTAGNCSTLPTYFVIPVLDLK